MILSKDGLLFFSFEVDISIPRTGHSVGIMISLNSILKSRLFSLALNVFSVSFGILVNFLKVLQPVIVFALFARPYFPIRSKAKITKWFPLLAFVTPFIVAIRFWWSRSLVMTWMATFNSVYGIISDLSDVST